MLEFFLSVVSGGSKVVHQVAGQVALRWSTRWSGGYKVVHQMVRWLCCGPPGGRWCPGDFWQVGLGDDGSTCDADQVVLGDDPVNWVVVVVVVVVFLGGGGLSLRYQGSNLPTGT